MPDPVPREIALPAGRHLLVRPARPEDVPGFVALYASLDDADRYRRFFSCFHPTGAFVTRWIDDCARKGVGLVAEVEGDVVAEAGFVGLPDGDAEFAMTVAPGWRGWLGPYLLQVLVEEAAARGIPNLEADILLENRQMLALVRRRRPVATARTDFTSVHVRIGTGGEGPTWPPDGHRPRVVVEARSMHSSTTAALGLGGMDAVTCPRAAGGAACPLDAGASCRLVEGAAAVLLAVPAERAAVLAAAHARLHPGVVVLADKGSVCAAAAEGPAPEGLAAALVALAPSFAPWAVPQPSR